MDSSLNAQPNIDAAVREQLTEIARQYGTPTYAFDVRTLKSQVEKLRSHLPPQVDVLYSLKANASLGLCDVFRQCGIGADVASAGEFETAIAAGFPEDQIFVAGPYKMAETIQRLRDCPKAIVSIDSLSEFQMLSEAGLSNQAVLRLRPDFGSCAVVPAGSESRFGFTGEQLARCRELLASSTLEVIGFHVFAGSQVLDDEKLIDQLREALDLSLRAADTLGIQATYINLGGGFGIPYGPNDAELNLTSVSENLAELVEQAAPARLVIELGRYLVAEAGWYLSSVVGHQTFQAQPAVVMDGGVHQRADMCGLCLRSNQLPPLVLKPTAPNEQSNQEESPLTPISVLGCLSLPDDVMLESALLPELQTGDVLAFHRAGAYGLWSSAVLFHGSPLPAEVAFDDTTLQLMRHRKPAISILDDQLHVSQPSLDSTASSEKPIKVG